MEPPPLISRKRHFFYVLVFSVAVWLFLLELIGGFIPMFYQETTMCPCQNHMRYSNITFAINGIIGIVTGLIFAYPFHRWMIIIHSKPKDKEIPISWMAKSGRKILGWRGLVFLVATAGIYILGNFVAHRYYKVHPTLNTTYTGRYWSTGFHCATNAGFFNIARNAISAGIDINIRDSFGHTPLHYRCLHDRRPGPNMTELLLANGADVHAKNIRGQTPLHIAAWSAESKDIALMLDKGADVNAINNRGESVLDVAIEYKEIYKERQPQLYSELEKVITLLRAHGAKTGKELKASSVKGQGSGVEKE